MTINDQDIAWASLPSYSRELARNMYKTSHDGNVKFLLENLYGKHNLTSDTEPEEILFYPRKDVQEFYAEICKTIDRSQETNVRICSQGKIIALKSLFGDKCLPDKEQPKPKFKAGDIVIAKTWVGEQFPQKIVMVANDVAYFEKGNLAPIVDLEPYTEESKEPMEEKESGKEDNFTTKELNLCELLKGCEREKFYHLLHGDVTLEKVIPTDIIDEDGDIESPAGIYYIINPDQSSTYIAISGCWDNKSKGIIIFYPSRTLYEKYPLDAYSAWMEWKAERKPKHTLQAQIRLISNDGKTIEDYECVEVEVPNIDLTQAAEAVRETLMKIHEKKLK